MHYEPTEEDHAVRHTEQPSQMNQSKKDYNEDSDFVGGPNLSIAETIARVRGRASINDHSMGVVRLAEEPYTEDRSQFSSSAMHLYPRTRTTNIAPQLPSVFLSPHQALPSS